VLSQKSKRARYQPTCGHERHNFVDTAALDLSGKRNSRNENIYPKNLSAQKLRRSYLRIPGQKLPNIAGEGNDIQELSIFARKKVQGLWKSPLMTAQLSGEDGYTCRFIL